MTVLLLSCMTPRIRPQLTDQKEKSQIADTEKLSGSLYLLALACMGNIVRNIFNTEALGSNIEEVYTRLPSRCI